MHNIAERSVQGEAWHLQPVGVAARTEVRRVRHQRAVPSRLGCGVTQGVRLHAGDLAERHDRITPIAHESCIVLSYELVLLDAALRVALNREEGGGVARDDFLASVCGPRGVEGLVAAPHAREAALVHDLDAPSHVRRQGAVDYFSTGSVGDEFMRHYSEEVPRVNRGAHCRRRAP